MTPRSQYYRSHNEPLALPINEIRRMYKRGLSMQVIADHFGVHPMTIHRHMKRNKILARRKGTYGHPWGPDHQNWKGDNATYNSLHERLVSRFGKPKKCEMCGTADLSRTYEWANLTGNYADISDYKRMCRSCHKQFDHKRRLNGDNLHGGATKPLPRVK